MVRFLHRVGRLKALPRSGWRHCGVPAGETESVADHSYRTAILAWLAAASHPELDRDRVLKLALVHDLAEALAGDPTPYDPADVAEDAEARRVFFSRRHVRDDERATAKRAAETAAMRELVADLPPPLAAELADLPPPLAAELAALWAEADAKETPEARFAKQVDKLETYLQSVEYLAADPSRPMASFAADAAAAITDPALRGLRDAIGDEPT